MPNTYVALRTETVTGNPASSVTFDLTGISGYTDLVVIADFAMSSPSGTAYIVGRVGNGSIDTGSNYSSTVLVGNGSTATSYRTSNVSYFQCDTYITGSNRAMFETNFQSYANTSVNKTILGRTSSAATNASAMVSLWRSTSAITTIRFYDFTGNSFAVGSTFSLYGIANADQGSAKATGGIITEDSQYWYHTFAASGAFIPKQSLTCDILAVAGGGGGGDPRGGGGGAGGVLLLSSQSVTATSYSVTVGAGGPASFSNRGTSGVNSTFQGLTAAVGGGGGGGDSNSSGLSGGSGGGEYSSGTPGTGTVGQGNDGGSTTQAYSGSGGGGAGAVGGTSTSVAGGNGGVGTTAYNSWSLVTSVGENISGTYYLGGGGGGGWGPSSGSGTAGVGGLGGGGNGQVQNSTAATAGKPNTGGGGGAGGGVSGSSYGTPAAGGSGVVIVRYAK